MLANILNKLICILYETIVVGKCTMHADSCGLKIRKYMREIVKWNYLINFELAINYLWLDPQRDTCDIIARCLTESRDVGRILANIWDGKLRKRIVAINYRIVVKLSVLDIYGSPHYDSGNLSKIFNLCQKQLVEIKSILIKVRFHNFNQQMQRCKPFANEIWVKWQLTK